MGSIKTRILILSDTHADPWTPVRSGPVDVAIHCGDMTEESTLAEFRHTIALLQSIDAPLKLVIAGNHDFTLDDDAFQRQMADANVLRTRAGESALTAAEFEAAYGRVGDARKMLATSEDADADADTDADTDHGIRVLDEGHHRFALKNGAALSVYASPYTPSRAGGWGFHYDPAAGHTFAIPDHTDIAVTHGPPHGVLDMTDSRQRAGCPHLFAAVARARPRVHCFGHIHEGWGAKLVAWRGGDAPSSAEPSHFRDIDNGKSTTVETLARLRPGKFDSAEDVAAKAHKVAQYQQAGLLHSSHCAGDAAAIVAGQSTLFVNAAIQGREDGVTQWPWMIDMDLPPV